MGNDITFPSPEEDNFPINGFVPAGIKTNKFTGNLDGKSNIITGLFISNSSLNYVGLIGYNSSNSVVKDVVLLDVNITGDFSVGGLIGLNEGTVTSYTTGSVTGRESVGGMVGINFGKVIGYATGSVTGSGSVIGGLGGA